MGAETSPPPRPTPPLGPPMPRVPPSRFLPALCLHLKGSKETIWLKNNPKYQIFLISSQTQPHVRGGHQREVREGHKEGGFCRITSRPVATSPGCLGCNASETARNFGNGWREEGCVPRGTKPQHGWRVPTPRLLPAPCRGWAGGREGRGGCTAAVVVTGTTPFTALSQIWQTF